MSGAFEHSIKVPRLYKTVAKIVQTVREDGASLKQLVYLKQHPNIKGVYALALTTLQHASQLDQLIRSTRILMNQPRLDAWLARVLITELLWGKQKLQSECKPVQTVLGYAESLRKELKNTTAFDPPTKRKVEKPRYVRVNTLTMSVNEAIPSFREEGWRFTRTNQDYAAYLETVSSLSERDFTQDIHVPELLVFPPRTQFYNHPGYTSGDIVLQDKASCLPAFLLDAKPGSVVLDMCAAPGMKTSHLAAMLQNKGKIYAVEIDKRRYQTLCEIVASTNSTCVETVNSDVMTLDNSSCPNVEYILVDPSCSGSGMLDRFDVSSSDEKCAPGRLKNLQSFQILILRHALLDFPSAKRVVYSTCSTYPEENEQVIDEIQSQVGDAYELIPAKKLMADNWSNFSSTEYKCGDKCLYARPETDLSNGFFVAVFQRNFDVPLPESTRRKRKPDPSTNDQTIDSTTSAHDPEEDTDQVGKKRRKKHKSNRATNSHVAPEAQEERTDDTPVVVPEEISNEPTDSTAAPKKKKKKCKKSHEDLSEPEDATKVEPDTSTEHKVKRSKKSKKSKERQ